jgi:hypothetical protein
LVSGRVRSGQFDLIRLLSNGFDRVGSGRVSDSLVSGHFEFWVGSFQISGHIRLVIGSSIAESFEFPIILGQVKLVIESSNVGSFWILGPY